MKNLLFVLASALMITTACGPSAEEKAAAQEANEEMVNEKVDEIMESLDESAEEMTSDSAGADSTMAE